MEFTFSAEDEAFRSEVRAFLQDHLTEGLRAYTRRMTSVYSDKETALEWQAVLVRQGWGGSIMAG